MRAAEGLAAMLIASVEHRAVGKHHAQRLEHAVTIGVRATTHARSVVHNNATHHGRIFRCRVGGEGALERSQDGIDTTAHDARLQRDGRGIGSNAVTLPVLARDNHDGRSHRLSAQTRSGGAEGDRQLHLARHGKQLSHLLLGCGAHDHLRNVAIETGIGAPCQGAQVVGIDALTRHKGRNAVHILFISLLHGNSVD